MEDFAQKAGGGGVPGSPVSGAHWGDYYPGTIEISMSSTAILLLAHGTPNRLSEMSDYLQHVTGGRPMPPHVISELQHRYAEIGLKEEPLPDGPPLTRWTLRQAELLEESARHQGLRRHAQLASLHRRHRRSDEGRWSHPRPRPLPRPPKLPHLNRPLPART